MYITAIELDIAQALIMYTLPGCFMSRNYSENYD